MKERVSAPLGSPSSAGVPGKPSAGALKDMENPPRDGSQLKRPQGVTAQENPKESRRDIPEPTTEKPSGQVEREAQ